MVLISINIKRRLNHPIQFTGLMDKARKRATRMVGETGLPKPCQSGGGRSPLITRCPSAWNNLLSIPYHIRLLLS